MVSPLFEREEVKQQPSKRARVEPQDAAQHRPLQAGARPGQFGYVAEQWPQSPPWREDDEKGHYVFGVGDYLARRYRIIKKMGEGTFGRVLECWDLEKRETVAIKVVRSTGKYRHAAKYEIKVLQRLAENDRGGRLCLQIKDWFEYRNHICIVCEKLGPSLFDFIRTNKYRPLPVDLVREFGHQLLESVAYMHDLHLIHTDLKPENILLVSSHTVEVQRRKRSSMVQRLPKSSSIKLIDFGNTVPESEVNSGIVSTRHYRAPEVILGLGWTYPCDIWSVGCILVELCTGEALFKTHESLEHLAMMERVLGRFPVHMIRKANESARHYVRRTKLNWPEGAVSRESIRAVNELCRLEVIISHHVDHSRSDLIDLLRGLLEFDPSIRLTAHEALKHPFFRNGFK